MNNFIEALPFPKKAATWLAVITTLVVAYIFYYMAAYPYLKNIYEEQLEKEQFNFPNDQFPICKITVRIPEYISDFEAQWAYLEIENPAGGNKIDSLTMFLTFPSKENAYTNQLLLESYSSEEMLDNSVQFNNIYPGMRLFARLPFLIDKASSDDQKIQLLVMTPNNNLSKSYELDYPKVHPRKSFLYSFSNQILLPPWSNGVIILGIIFIFYFVEESNVWKKTRLERKILAKHCENSKSTGKLIPLGKNGNYLFQNPAKNIGLMVFLIQFFIIFISGLSILLCLCFVIPIIFQEWEEIHWVFIAISIVNMFLFISIFILNFFKSDPNDLENQNVMNNELDPTDLKIKNSIWEFNTYGKNFLLYYTHEGNDKGKSYTPEKTTAPEPAEEEKYE